MMSVVAAVSKPLLALFHGAVPDRQPIWLMRQAGRYLPEYRQIRATAASFLDFCYTPELAIEATLQPIRRFGFDASIIFSDILVIPDALGQPVRFAEGEGPRLEAIESPEGMARLAGELDLDRLAPVYDALRGVQAALPQETTLIGFCGAPWTLATYMIAGRGTPDQAPARLFAYHWPEAFALLIDRLVSACITHCRAQIEAGAEVIQIFDSWAGVLPDREFASWCRAPVARIVAALKASHPSIPVIGFPRAMSGDLGLYAKETGCDGISLDTSAVLGRARAEIPATIVTQGNLDPLALVAGGEALDRAIEAVVALRGQRHIANLGHGILPQTPIAHVERFIAGVRE